MCIKKSKDRGSKISTARAMHDQHMVNLHLFSAYA